MNKEILQSNFEETVDRALEVFRMRTMILATDSVCALMSVATVVLMDANSLGTPSHTVQEIQRLGMLRDILVAISAVSTLATTVSVNYDLNNPPQLSEKERLERIEHYFNETLPRTESGWANLGKVVHE